MSDYLGKLVSRSAQPQADVTPRSPSRFEPLGRLAWQAAPPLDEPPTLMVEEAERPAARPVSNRPREPHATPSPVPPSRRGSVPGSSSQPMAQDATMPPVPYVPAQDQAPASWDAAPSPRSAPAAAEPRTVKPSRPEPYRRPDVPRSLTAVREVVREHRVQPVPHETVVERKVVHVHHQPAEQRVEVRTVPAEPQVVADRETTGGRNGTRTLQAAPTPAREAELRSEASAQQEPGAAAGVDRPRVHPRVVPTPALLRPASAPEAPTIHVSIGRVEVRATSAPTEASPPPRPRSRPAESSLAAYLKERAEGAHG